MSSEAIDLKSLILFLLKRGNKNKFTLGFLKVYGEYKMTDLISTTEDTIKDRFYKDPYEVKFFFQRLINGKELQAYSFGINKEIIEKDTVDEKVIRIIKGVTLEPTNNIDLYSPSGSYFFEDPIIGIKYIIEMDFHSSNSHSRYSKSEYGNCRIRRLVKNPDLRKLEITSFRQLDIPKGMIDGILNYAWTDKIREYIYHEKLGHLTSEGEQDKLFKKFCEFVRSK